MQHSVALLAVVASCGGPADGTLVFGEFETPCPATVLANEPDDADVAAEGRACFLAAHHIGHPVVWDLLVPTVEGDPLLWRHDYDGETVTITEDFTRDEFGRAGVSMRRCRGIQLSADGVSVTGIACEEVPDGDGFASDSLP